MPLTGEQLIDTASFEVGGTKFYAMRMKPLVVIGVARRLAPVLMIVRGLQAASPKVDPGTGAGDAADAHPEPQTPPQDAVGVLGKAAPMLEALSRLSDDDVNAVIGACLSVVRRPDLALPSLWNASAQTVADQTLTAGEVMGVVGNVLAKVFGDLMQDLPSIGLPGLKVE